MNLGQGGDRTQNVLWRLQNGEVEGIQPKIAMLMIGTNNIGRGETPEDTILGIKAVLAELEIRDGTCAWWEEGEMWESSCGVAYNFLSDGPVENEHEFCHKCGNRISIDEARHD